MALLQAIARRGWLAALGAAAFVAAPSVAQIQTIDPNARSEERRVGKECRSRWSPYH